MYALLNLWMIGTALASVYLFNSGVHRVRWAALVGLVGQPARVYLTVDNDEPGMFVVSLFFTVCYARGVWDGFVRRGGYRG
ncbi:hypothetical protein [Cupriavidus metallidurans]|jgi:hypothetical protein|uniref:Uncharacterized protein n=1 Tax=Cupriavidus metallidurans TaxID=119219 RepID=A0A482IQB2_9BURK|nr:hypothetical protein [Cupriavidus metallidurans]QBP10136.1 hypothetical protein DDF84_010390 [Cupriavidus metallidurans]QWC87213.1 hypothetical protein KB891_08935 [Cupriavidus metallidurans]